MEPEQPYRPPSANLSARPVAGGGAAAITPNMVQILESTRPWVVFLGVLGMIGCGFIAIAAVVFIGAGNAMGIEGLEGVGGAALGGVYVFMAFLYFFPSLYLLRYGRAIKRIRGRGDVVAAEDALRQQLSFWRFVGILAAVVLVLYGVVLALVSLAAVFASGS